VELLYLELEPCQTGPKSAAAIGKPTLFVETKMAEIKSSY